ncbi:MAG: alanine:cation symporter family protein [Bilophila wadsworthia]
MDLRFTGAAMTSAAFETSLPGIGGIDDLPDLLLHHSPRLVRVQQRCAIYFFGDSADPRIVYCIAIPVGVLTQLDVVWLLADTCNALMAIPNLIAILLLSPVLFKLVKEDESKDSIFKH